MSNWFGYSLTEITDIARKKTDCQKEIFGGPEESRTPDLLCAKQALYQLSYGPNKYKKYTTILSVTSLPSFHGKSDNVVDKLIDI